MIETAFFLLLFKKNNFFKKIPPTVIAEKDRKRSVNEVTL